MLVPLLSLSLHGASHRFYKSMEDWDSPRQQDDRVRRAPQGQ